MPDNSSEPTIEVDSDWKAEAAREKQKLIQQEQQAADRGVTTDRAFLELLNLLGMQASISLGGYQTSAGQTMPPDLEVARQQIAMLEALQRKTEGNLSDDERRGMSDLLHGLRMQYVKTAESLGQAGPAAGGSAPPGGQGPTGG